MYDYMLENTDPEKVFFQIDLYWIQVGGASALDYFERYPSRFELWHVKDDLEVGASGKIDFEAIYKEAAKSGMKYQIVEQDISKPKLCDTCKALYNLIDGTTLKRS